ncbi:1200_t:CDS:2 [Funneliformis geosporum]|uniref:1200_t:CDS:1 n=1 Tax=Funneliformis geosporum TaxID=1117311 RepID=A0A9W4WX75_9GLOM|nr:1200_t:CDS:2 [Funneliformis geosporum]
MSLNEAECYDAIDDLVDKHIKSGSFLYSMVLILTVFTEYSGILYGDLNIGSYLGKAFTFRLFTCTSKSKTAIYFYINGKNKSKGEDSGNNQNGESSENDQNEGSSEIFTQIDTRILADAQRRILRTDMLKEYGMESLIKFLQEDFKLKHIEEYRMTLGQALELEDYIKELNDQKVRVNLGDILVKKYTNGSKISSNFKIPPLTVYDTINRYKKTDSSHPIKRSERPNVLSNHGKHLLQRIVYKDRFSSLSEARNYPNLIFQQDGASCHTSSYTTWWMESHGILVLNWVMQSPDLNPIEYL